MVLLFGFRKVSTIYFRKSVLEVVIHLASPIILFGWKTSTKRTRIFFSINETCFPPESNRRVWQTKQIYQKTNFKMEAAAWLPSAFPSQFVKVSANISSSSSQRRNTASLQDKSSRDCGKTGDERKVLRNHIRMLYVVGLGLVDLLCKY